MGVWRMCVRLLWLGVLAVAVQPANAQSDDARQFNEQFRPLLTEHCVACHSGEKPKGDLRLDNLAVDFADAATREHWAAVVERLRAGEMPPKDKPRPPEKDVLTLVDWLEARVSAADAAARAAEGRVVLRRLNRTEYENTINDLLGIQANL